MKALRKIGCILAAMCLSLSMISCSEDGPGEGQGESSVLLGSKTFETPYGFWTVQNSGNSTYAIMEFYNADPLSSNLPNSMDMVLIEFELPDGQEEITSTKIKGGEYHIYTATGVTISSEGLQCESRHGDISNSDLKITRNGSNYTINIDNATVSDDNNSYRFKFSYSGNMKNQTFGE